MTARAWPRERSTSTCDVCGYGREHGSWGPEMEGLTHCSGCHCSMGRTEMQDCAAPSPTSSRLTFHRRPDGCHATPPRSLTVALDRSAVSTRSSPAWKLDAGMQCRGGDVEPPVSTHVSSSRTSTCTSAADRRRSMGGSVFHSFHHSRALSGSAVAVSCTAGLGVDAVREVMAGSLGVRVRDLPSAGARVARATRT